jgi:hypothetical protein
MEAMRCLKCRLSDIIYGHMVDEAMPRDDGHKTSDSAHRALPRRTPVPRLPVG